MVEIKIKFYKENGKQNLFYYCNICTATGKMFLKFCVQLEPQKECFLTNFAKQFFNFKI